MSIEKIKTEKLACRRYATLSGTYGTEYFNLIFSCVMSKNDANLLEKYLRSLHFSSTGQYLLLGMKILYPAKFNKGLPIKPPL